MDLLIRQLQDTFAPSEIGVALYDDDGRAAPELHTWPAGAAGAAALLAAAEGGARCIEQLYGRGIVVWAEG